MSRIGYSDDESFQGQFALWRANVNRCLHGKRGLEALRELRNALISLPVKRLVAESLALDGEVCAIGALLVARSPNREAALKELETIYDDSAAYAASKGLPEFMAWAVVEENDMTLGHLTPEQRYERMLVWVERMLAGEKFE